jgi:purine-cytosine permease-like protein
LQLHLLDLLDLLDLSFLHFISAIVVGPLLGHCWAVVGALYGARTGLNKVKEQRNATFSEYSGIVIN